MADAGKEITRPEEPYMIHQDGIKLYKYTSDSGMCIIQHPTERKYTEAIDVETAPYTYTETDESIEETELIDEIQQKAAAFNYLTGRGEK